MKIDNVYKTLLECSYKYIKCVVKNESELAHAEEYIRDIEHVYDRLHYDAWGYMKHMYTSSGRSDA